MKNLIRLGASLLTSLITMAVSADISRTASGKPDLTGTYNIATLTPLEHPPDTLPDVRTITEDEAEARTAQVKAEKEAAFNKVSDPNREAPPVGGVERSSPDGGNVGGHNSWWLDSGDTFGKINGEFRTSIIYKPSDGRKPAMTQKAKQKMTDRMQSPDASTEKAWRSDTETHGPYDNPESLSLGDRCLLGASLATPLIPNELYNNYVRIVQSGNKVMILTEMIHDARIIRLNSEHLPDDIRKWTGDSIGWWEDDTLAVDTTNFTDTPILDYAGENLHVVERFSRLDEKTLLYNFTVKDQTVWVEPWSGEYEWKQTGEKLYEYACHEGNYSMGNILRGARLLEQEAKDESHARAMTKIHFSAIVMTALIFALILTLTVKVRNRSTKNH